VPNNLPDIILASGSPRRRELLASLDIEFEVIKPDVDEEGFDLEHLSPNEQVLFLAKEKAQAVINRLQNPDKLIIASDTLVAVDGKTFGKPTDQADAARMLGTLQGRTHQVYSAIAVGYQGYLEADVLKTDVTFQPMDAARIERYIATGEPMDKAGAYAIQGFGALNIQRIEGCYFNVVGMSLTLLDRLLARFDLELLALPA